MPTSVGTVILSCWPRSVIHVGKADCVGRSCKDPYQETCAPCVAADASALHHSSLDRAPLANLVPCHQAESPWSLMTRRSATGSLVALFE